MKLTLVFLLFFGGLGTCQADVPRCFHTIWNPADFAEAVNYYVALGPKPTAQELTALANEHKLEVSFLCRVLYQPKGNQPLRPPFFGDLVFLPQNMADAEWPLWPVVASGRSFFVLDSRYILAGVPEEPREYVAYCRQHGVFRRESVPVPTRTEARRDADTLRRSPAWRKLRWSKASSPSTDSTTEPWVWQNVKTQAEAVR